MPLQPQSSRCTPFTQWSHGILIHSHKAMTVLGFILRQQSRFKGDSIKCRLKKLLCMCQLCFSLPLQFKGNICVHHAIECKDVLTLFYLSKQSESTLIQGGKEIYFTLYGLIASLHCKKSILIPFSFQQSFEKYYTTEKSECMQLLGYIYCRDQAKQTLDNLW